MKAPDSYKAGAFSPIRVTNSNYRIASMRDDINVLKPKLMEFLPQQFNEPLEPIIKSNP